MNNIKLSNIQIEEISSKKFDIELIDKELTILYEKNGLFDDVLDMLALKRIDKSVIYIYNSQNVSLFHDSDLDELRNRDIFVINKENGFFNDISIRENLILACSLNNNQKAIDSIDLYAKELGIQDLLDKTLLEITSYETLLCKILLMNIVNPFLMLVYDLNGFLNEEELSDFIEIIIKNNKKHKCSCVVSTSAASAIKYSDNVYLIEDKEVTLQ